MADLSFSDIQNLVRAGLQQEHAGATYIYVRDCYPGSVVYSVEKSGGASEPPNGTYYRRSYAISESESNYGVTFGKVETVAPKREYQTVKAFTMAQFSAGDDWVEYEGLVFEAGDYPDKGVSFTPEELVAAAESFAPVDNDLEHLDTILSGKLGSLMSVTAAEDGNVLIGRVRVPKWLHDVNGGQPIKTSLAWSSDKAIVGNALTLSPRIKSAQVAAAFAEFGKVTKGAHGARVPAVQLGALGAEYEAAQPRKEKKPMKMKEIFAALASAFSGGGSIDPDTEINVGEAAPVVFADPEAQKLKSRLEQAHKAMVATAASAFAEGLVRDRRIVPSQAEAVKAVFASAAADDLAAGGATFSEGDGSMVDGPRVKALRDMYASAPQHSLTQEQMRDARALAGDAKAEGPKFSSSEIFADRAATAAGGK